MKADSKKRYFISAVAVLLFVCTGCASSQTKTVILPESTDQASLSSMQENSTSDILLTDSTPENRNECSSENKSYFGFTNDGELMIGVLSDGKTKFGIENTYIKIPEFLEREFDYVSYIVPSPQGGKIVFMSNGSIYIADLQQKSINEVKGYAGDISSNLSWSNNSRNISFVLYNNGNYGICFYDTLNDKVQFIDDNTIIKMILEYTNNGEYAPIDVYLIGYNYVAFKTMSEGMGVLIIIPKEQVESGKFDYSDIYFEDVTNTGSTPFANDNYIVFLDSNNSLVKLDVENNVKTYIAYNVDNFCISGDNNIIMYSVAKSDMESVYKVSMNDFSDCYSVGVYKSIIDIDTDFYGKKLLVLYEGTDSESNKYIADKQYALISTVEEEAISNQDPITQNQIQ